MNKILYTLIITGLTLTTAQAHWEKVEVRERPGTVFRAQTLKYTQAKKEHRVRHKHVEKTLSAATVDYITPKVLLHFNCFINNGESFVQKFFVTPNVTGLASGSKDFNGMETIPWATIVLKVSPEEMSVSFVSENGKDKEPNYAQTMADAIMYISYTHARRISNLPTISVENDNETIGQILDKRIEERKIAMFQDSIRECKIGLREKRWN